jgi:hypothetical protein
MNKMRTSNNLRHLTSFAYAAGLVSLVLAVAFSLTGGVALAASQTATAPGLGAAGSYSALGKAGVTNSGPSVLSGNVGADISITGFTGAPEGSAAALIFAPDVNGAEGDALAAYGALAAQGGAAGLDLAGTNTVTPGVYDVAASTLDGTLTLAGPGVYIFQSTSSITASGSMIFSNGADECNVNVFWQIPISMSIGTNAKMIGTIIANSGSITFGTGASLNGRALALVGTVTLLNNHIFAPICAAAPTATPGTSSPSATSVPVINAVTGVDLTGSRSLASRQMENVGLGFLGLGILLLGFAVLRKR